MNGRVVYRQQFTRCGKARCRKCNEGEGHGPYWYAYWNENGRTKTKYIGVRLPPGLDAQQGHSEGEAVHHRPTPILRVYLLGQFRVEYRDGNAWSVVDNRTWQHRRVRSLFGCLLSSPGRRLSRQQAMKLLWPELEREIAANRLNGAVHELRSILEPGIERTTGAHILHIERDSLELADNSLLWVDAEAFRQLLKQADTLTNTEQAEQLLEEARDLYKGSYLLEELYSEWATQPRDALQQQWSALMLKLAKLRAARGALSEAIEALDTLRAADLTNESGLQLLMVYLTRLHRRGEALRIYRQHAALLKREYESEPMAETRALYTSLRRGHIPDEYLQEETPPIMAIGNIPPSPEELSMLSPEPINMPLHSTWQPRLHKYRLLGRERELEEVRHMLASIASASTCAQVPHFLGLSGEPGSGKTRLAEELSQEAYTQAWAVAWSRGRKTEQNHPYALWIELAASLFAHQASPLLAKHSFLTASTSKRMPLWESIREALFMVSQTYPLLLVLDDLQWGDEESINLLGYLLNHSHDQRILFTGIWRDSELDASPVLSASLQDLQRKQALVSFALERLTEPQVASMVAHLPQDVAQHIRLQAAGNPFFVEELVRQAEASPTQTRMPAGITELFERQLCRVSADCRALLAKVAQAGEVFEFNRLLAHEQAEDTALDLLEEALQAKLLYEEATSFYISHVTYRFWHPLLVSYLQDGDSR
jgi:DNA-binding SARP family transcriptional activator